MFDVFIAPLRCPGCDATVQDAEIQTYLRDLADGSALFVGDDLDPADLETESILASGYLLVRPPAPGEPIRLVDMWSCSTCSTEQWALVEIADHSIQRIEAVTLDRETLRAAHFISEANADLLAASLRDEPSASDETSVETLLRRLP